MAFKQPLSLEQLVGSAEARLPTKEELTSVAALVNEMRRLEQAIVANGLELKDLKESLEEIVNHKLPDMVRQIGIGEVKMLDGTTLTIGTEYYGSISEDNRPIAAEWLRENGHGSLIKNEIKLAFGMGEESDAAKLKRRLEKAGYSYEQKESIHASTLKAFIKEQTEKGVILPDCFNTFVQDVAKVVVPKKKKSKEKR